MCGIAGFLPTSRAPETDRALVADLCAALAHRGPDAQGVVSSGPMVLGHRRLSIIDLRPEAGQPMANEDESLWLVINGEIYNFLELRRELEGLGHRFRSNSDSEVVLHLYEQVGPACLERLRGMFALALWDSRAERLLLARDRYGKKPLCYHLGPRGLVFASELQALVRAGVAPREPWPEAIDAYLALQYVPAPWTAYRDVYKLPPGHFAVVQAGELPCPRPYHELRFDRHAPGSLEELARRVRHTLEEATRIRMVADVPVGAFLSGGVDSSAVVALMARHSSRPVKTFSIGFTRKDHSELAFARLVAERYQTEHHELVVEPNMVSIVPELALHYGEPYADTSAVPTWYLSEFTRQGVTVALSGDAGDEGFGGYNRYRLAELARRLHRLPGPLQKAIAGLLQRLPAAALRPARDFGRRLGQDDARRYLGLVAHFPHEDKLSLYSPEMQRRFAEDLTARRFGELLGRGTATHPVDRLMELDIHTYLPDDILVKVDIAAMAHALEVRNPLLDQEVIALAASIPARHKVGLRGGKLVLRRAVADLVPRPILARRKRGFALPIDRWMREELASMSRDLLLDHTARSRGWFEPTRVADLLDRHQRGEPRGLQIWNLLMLEHWFRAFIDRSPA
jgi:asparagine synthase (glutamine-hydrolysing)